ncbi:glycosyltransferase [Microbulbifer sp. CnH-101-E]|uniref:glycosyltransferase n=1 Tax=unclassified Microbulbifer TaxID=2619833 RepID=UPI004039981B
MKILFSTMQFGPGYNQGTEKYIRNLALNLSKRGCDVIVAGGDPEGILGNRTFIDEGGFRQIKLPTFGWGTTEGDSVDNYLSLLSELKPDLVHMVNPAHIGINLLNAAQKLGIPYFISITDFWWLCPKHTLTFKSGDFCSGFADYETCFSCISDIYTDKPTKSAYKRHPGGESTAKILLSSVSKNPPLAISLAKKIVNKLGHPSLGLPSKTVYRKV